MEVEKVCVELWNSFTENSSKEDMFMECVVEKLSALYIQESAIIDTLLDDIVKGIDLSDISRTSNALKKLNKHVLNGRENLLCMIERMCS